MPSTLRDVVEGIIREYRMNWASLKIIHRQDRSLGVGNELNQATGQSTYFLFNADTNTCLGHFSSISEVEALIQREASRVFGTVRSSKDAAAQYSRLLKEIAKDDR